MALPAKPIFSSILQQPSPDRVTVILTVENVFVNSIVDNCADTITDKTT